MIEIGRERWEKKVGVVLEMAKLCTKAEVKCIVQQLETKSMRERPGGSLRYNIMISSEKTAKALGILWKVI